MVGFMPQRSLTQRAAALGPGGVALLAFSWHCQESGSKMQPILPWDRKDSVMPYEITALWDEMPKGRIRKPKPDKYPELRALLSQIPEGQVAQVSLPKTEYRSFSAGIRAAGIQAGKKAEARYWGESAFVSWVPLTEENKPKRRGGRRPNVAAATPPAAASALEAPAPRRPGRPRRAAAG